MPKLPFALLTYRTRNLGDDIQTAAICQHLGRGQFLDRDACENWPEARVVLAGWWLETQAFPPPSHLESYPVSMHWQAGSRNLLQFPTVRDWFQRQVEAWHRPIGARDQHTCHLLIEHGIPAEVTGCVTLTLPAYAGPRAGLVAVDVPARELLDQPGLTVIHATQIDETLTRCSPATRLQRARERLSLIQQAELVVTSRLHILLPCVAFQTPVVFIPPKYQPERWQDYASLASATIPESEFTACVSSGEVWKYRNRPPRPVPEFTQRLRKRLLALRDQWQLTLENPDKL